MLVINQRVQASSCQQQIIKLQSDLIDAQKKEIEQLSRQVASNSNPDISQETTEEEEIRKLVIVFNFFVVMLFFNNFQIVILILMYIATWHTNSLTKIFNAIKVQYNQF